MDASTFSKSINRETRRGRGKKWFSSEKPSPADKRMQMEERGREGGTVAGRVGRPRGRGRGVERRRKEVEQRRGGARVAGGGKGMP